MNYCWEGILAENTEGLSKDSNCTRKRCKKSRKRIAYLKAVTCTELQFMGGGVDAVMPCCAQLGAELCCGWFFGYAARKAAQAVCWWAEDRFFLVTTQAHQSQVLYLKANFFDDFQLHFQLTLLLNHDCKKSSKGLWKRFALSAVSEGPEAAQYTERLCNLCLIIQVIKFKILLNLLIKT